MLRCRYCGTEDPISQHADSIDDDLEDKLAWVPLDRL